MGEELVETFRPAMVACAEPSRIVNEARSHFRYPLTFDTKVRLILEILYNMDPVLIVRGCALADGVC